MTDTAHSPRTAAVARDLRAAGIQPKIQVLSSPTPTAASAAALLGVDVGAIANSLVFSAGGSPVLIMTSGAHRVDTGWVAEHLNLPALDRADPGLVRAATGQVIGGVAPCGHPSPLTTYVDTALAAHSVVWAAGGTADTMVPLTYEQLLAVTHGKEISVVRH